MYQISAVLAARHRMLIFVGLVAGLLGLVYWYLNSVYSYWKTRGVPNPPPVPLIGNLGTSLLMLKSLGEVYSKIYNDFPGHLYVGFYKLLSPTVLVRDTDLIKTITIKEFSSFHDNDVELDEEVDPLFGKNPFVLKGERWKIVRSQVSGAITTGKIKNMFTLMADRTRDLVKCLERPEPGFGGRDVKDILTRYTTDVVAVCAFGLEANALSDPASSKFLEMGKKLFTGDSWTMFKGVILFSLPDVAKFFKLKIISDEITNWFTGTLEEAIKYREENNIVRNDYLDMMLSLKSKPGEYAFTNLDVMAQAMTFYADGAETSASALTFITYEVARNPHVQEKLREEVDRVLAKHGGEITYEAAQDMTYLDMVFAEGLRMYPPAPFLTKTCTKDFRLPAPRGEASGPAVDIKKGMNVVIPVYGIHHDPALYPEPDVFRPERFTEQAKAARFKGAYLPFGEGPRQCLGFRFAMAQLKAALIAIVANFEMKVNAKTSPTMEIDPSSILLAKKGGVWVDFKKRT